MTDYRFRGQKLTGIRNFKDKYRGQTAVICCSGPTLADYDDSRVPANWPRFAVNEAIFKLKDAASFWVLADSPIVLEYASHCPQSMKVLAMHEATRSIHNHFKGQSVYTTTSMPRPGDYDNPYEFYSRGTVMIGALEMARYMGFRKFFIFGLDCYAMRDHYYYVGSHPERSSASRRPLPLSEKRRDESTRVKRGVPNDVRIYVTPRLKNMIQKLNDVRTSKIWKGVEMWCVGSPWSQQTAIARLSLDEFDAVCKAQTKKEEASGVDQAEAERRRQRNKKDRQRRTERKQQAEQPKIKPAQAEQVKDELKGVTDKEDWQERVDALFESEEEKRETPESVKE